MSLSAKSQALVKVEAIEGVAETLGAADAIEVLADTFPAVSSNNESIQRNPARGSLSTLQPLPGGRDGSISLQHEMAGPITISTWTNATPPGFGKLLRACGMQERVGTKMAVDASWTTGTVVHHMDELVSNGIAPKTVRVLGDFFEGEDLYIFWEAVTTAALAADQLIWTGQDTNVVITTPSPVGSPSAIIYTPIDDEVSTLPRDGGGTGSYTIGAIVTGAVTGAKAEVWGGLLNAAAAGNMLVKLLTNSPGFNTSEAINGGGSTTPASMNAAMTQTHNPSLSIESRHQGPVRKIKGARGNWSLDVKNKDRPVFTFEFSGPGLAPTDAANVAFGSGIANQIPPVTVGSTLLLNGTFAPLYGDMAYQSNNELSLRDSPTDSSASGYLSNRIVNRAPTITLESETVRAAIFDLSLRHYDKAAIRTKQIFGSAILGNSFEIRCRSLAVDENSPTDKDGILADNTTLSCNSKSPVLDSTGAEIGQFTDDELFIYMY